MRVLALVPGDLSKQILFLPTIESLKQAFPSAEVGVVVDPAAKAAYSVSKLVNEVIPFDYQASNSPADWANLLGILRDREFEVALSVSPRWEEGLLLWLSGIPTRITYDTTRTPWFYTQTVSAGNSADPTSRYQALLSALQVKAQATLPALSVPEADITWAEAVRDRLGLQSGYVIFYPGMTSQGEAYPTASWLKIAADFQAKQPQMVLVLLKTAASAAAVSELGRRQQSLKVVEPDNLGRAAAMIAGADLVLTTEGEMMQVAIALKVFTLALLSADGMSAIVPTAGSSDRLLSLRSSTQQLADLPPAQVLEKVWGS